MSGSSRSGENVQRSASDVRKRAARPGHASARLAQRRKKAPAVAIVAKDRLAPVSTIQNMVNRAGKFHASFSSHLTANLLDVPPHFHRKNSEIHRLTPFLEYLRHRR
jgi:hypothetical protein